MCEFKAVKSNHLKRKGSFGISSQSQKYTARDICTYTPLLSGKETHRFSGDSARFIKFKSTPSWNSEPLHAKCSLHVELKNIMSWFVFNKMLMLSRGL